MHRDVVIKTFRSSMIFFNINIYNVCLFFFCLSLSLSLHHHTKERERKEESEKSLSRSKLDDIFEGFTHIIRRKKYPCFIFFSFYRCSTQE